MQRQAALPGGDAQRPARQDGLILQTEFRAACVRGQAFTVGQGAGDAAQRLCANGGHFNQAGALLEVVYPQRAGKAGGAAGGQHVVGAGTVVAQAFRGKAAHEDGTGVLELGQPGRWLGHRQLQMFRGNEVGNLAGFLQVSHLNQRTATRQRGADDVLARHLRQQALDTGTPHGQ